MKKIICLVLAVVMMTMVFVGCDMNSQDNADDAGKDDYKPTHVTTVSDNEANADVTAETTTVADTEADTSQNEVSETGISRGTIDGNVYTNNYLKFKFTKPESWYYSTDADIAALMNLGIEMFLNDQFKKALENNPSMYDMRVVDSATGTSIIVAYENLEKSFATNITEKQYIDAVKYQFTNISGISADFSDELVTVKLGGTEFTRVLCNVTTSGVTMTQVYYVHKADGYMSSVIVGIQGGYSVEQIEAMFQ